MEWITIALSSLILLISPAGVIVDQVIANQIRDRVDHVEKLAVRVDNRPNYDLLNGKVDKIRIASRGLYPFPDVRIDTLEVETDPIAVNMKALNEGKKHDLAELLDKPLQGAMRLVLTEDDINQALRSQIGNQYLTQLINKLVKQQAGAQTIKYELLSSKIELLGDNRIRLAVQMQKNNSNDATLDLTLEVGIKLISGAKIELVAPSAIVNGQPFAPQVLNRLITGLNPYLDLKTWKNSQILVRLLQLEIGDDQMQIAGFASLPPESK